MFHKVSDSRSQKSLQTMKVLALAKRVETQLDKPPDQGVFPAGASRAWPRHVGAKYLTADLFVADSARALASIYRVIPPSCSKLQQPVMSLDTTRYPLGVTVENKYLNMHVALLNPSRLWFSVNSPLQLHWSGSREMGLPQPILLPPSSLVTMGPWNLIFLGSKIELIRFMAQG